MRLIWLLSSFMLFASANGEAVRSNWEPKFYEGLKAQGEVLRPDLKACGRADCIELRHIAGAKKFGVEKPVRTQLALPMAAIERQE